MGTTNNKVETEKKQTTDEDIVENYLSSQRKPFSINDLVLNLNNRFKKNPLLKILDTLHGKDRIILTTFGKTIIYSAKDIDPGIPPSTSENKENFEPPSEDPLRLSEQILQLREEQTELNRDLKQLNSFILTEGKTPANKDLPQLIKNLQSSMEEITTRIDNLKREVTNNNNSSMINKDLINHIQRSNKILSKELKLRTQMTKNILKLLQQNNKPQELKELLEDIGFEEIL